MCHYPDLGSASDWSCRVWNIFQPIRSTTQIWVVTCHQGKTKERNARAREKEKG